jgi:hypothetical protein
VASAGADIEWVRPLGSRIARARRGGGRWLFPRRFMGLIEQPNPRPLRNTLEIVTLSWVFGSVWQTTVTGVPLTRFAAELHASPWQFGLLTAMPFLAALLSLPASLIIEHTGARKLCFLGGVYPGEPDHRAHRGAEAVLPRRRVSSAAAVVCHRAVAALGGQPPRLDAVAPGGVLVLGADVRDARWQRARRPRVD